MLTTIENEAFFGIRATDFTLPVGVTSIGNDAFRSASSLQRVFFLGNKPTIGTDAFTGVTSGIAYVKVTATGYPAVGSLMDGLTIAVGHTVTYDTKGGSTLAPGFWLWYESIVAPLPPTRTGHIFAGWSATDGGSALTFPYTPSTLAATTLYARWTALGSTPTPSPRPDMFKKIDSGTSFTLAMRQDGKLVTWGFNNTNQAQIPLGLINVIMSDIDVAHNYSLAVDMTGKLFGWGRNDFKQLDFPVTGRSNVSSASAGFGHILVLKKNGDVVGWGYNNEGQTDIPSYVRRGVTAVSAGFEHSLAIKNGKVIGWGDNSWGQADPPKNATDIVAISAGYQHSLALKRDGTVLCWGRKKERQCELPTQVKKITAISAGNQYSLAMDRAGAVYGWGLNSHNQTIVPAELGPASAIAAGVVHSVIGLKDGTVRAFGNPAHQVLVTRTP